MTLLSAAARFAMPLLLALAACTTSATVCRTEVALEERQQLMLARVMVNGTSVPGIFDTGAQASAVTETLVSRLGLLGDPRHASLMSGVGGAGMERNDALVAQFALAGFDTGEGHEPVISVPLDTPPDGPTGVGPAEPLGALIGADVLSHFDIDLDVAGHRAILYDPVRCQGKLPDWQMPATEVPVEVISSDRLLLTVKLDGHKLDALLDSGASGTVVDLSAAEKLGVTREDLARDPGGSGFGAAGVNFQRVLHTFHTLEIAGEHFDNPKLSVLDRSLRDADMLLGLDWLREHRIWISYRERKLLVAHPVGLALAR
jgi:predicted aspartyl protease